VPTSRTVIIAGVALAGAALALPFVRFPTVGSVNGFQGDAWPVLLPLAPVLLLAVVGETRRSIRTATHLGAILLSCLALVFAVAKLADAVEASRMIEDASTGAGSWALPGAVVIALTGCVLRLVHRPA
jgi:hypothetical protein